MLGDIISDPNDLGPATEALPVPTGAMPAPTGAMPAPTEALAAGSREHRGARPGDVLGKRYRVDQRIGIGGMAEVFRGHDAILGRDVAIKVFRNDTDLPDGSNGEQRRGAELHALAQLAHPNLITLYDGMVTADADGEPAYLVMELITGPNLAGKLSGGPLSEPEARAIGAQIADALAYVHLNGMVHRDVKPANILLGEDASGEDAQSRPRLSDFGIVRLMGSERVTTADFLVGTASYLAPEQARGVDVGPPADVYALGLVLLETLTGRRCFEGSAAEVAVARLTKSPDVPDGLPGPWPGLLAAMTAMDPEMRPAAAQVAEALRATGNQAWLAAAAAPAAATATAGALTAVIPAAAAGGSALGGIPAESTPVDGTPVVGAPAEGTPESAASSGHRGRRAALLVTAAALIAALGIGGYWLTRSPATDHPATPILTPTHSAAAQTTAQMGNTTTQAATTGTNAATSAVTSSTATNSVPATTTAPSTTAAPSTTPPPATSAATTAAATTTPPSASISAQGAGATGTSAPASATTTGTPSQNSSG